MRTLYSSGKNQADLCNELAWAAGLLSKDGDLRIFAEILKEHGDPRGEFISLYSALTTGHGPERTSNLLRLGEILRDHYDKLIDPLNAIPGLRNIEFRRGLVSGFTTELGILMDHGETLLCSTPIERVRVYIEHPDDLRALSRISSLAALERLELWIANDILPQRGRYPCAPSLDGHLEELVSSENLAALKMLVILEGEHALVNPPQGYDLPRSGEESELFLEGRDLLLLPVPQKNVDAKPEDQFRSRRLLCERHLKAAFFETQYREYLSLDGKNMSEILNDIAGREVTPADPVYKQVLLPVELNSTEDRIFDWRQLSTSGRITRQQRDVFLDALAGSSLPISLFTRQEIEAANGKSPSYTAQNANELELADTALIFCKDPTS
jgi:hypothetical protein